jgi:Flp pilus assembly protein TadD
MGLKNINVYWHLSIGTVVVDHQMNLSCRLPNASRAWCWVKSSLTNYRLSKAVRKGSSHTIALSVPGCLVLWLGICPLLWGQGAAGNRATAPQFTQFFAQGSQALQQGDNAAAEQAFRQALALAPQSVEILNNLAISLSRQGRDEEAIATYERALKLKPGDSITQRNLGVAYFRGHLYKNALPLLQSFAQTTPTFQSLDLTGLDFFALDQYRAAAVYLERASRLQPGDIPTLDILGKAYWRAKDYSGVTQVFNRIMAINPDSPEAHFMLGLAYDTEYKEEEARKEFQAVLTSEPNYPGVHSSLGLIAWRQHRVQEALDEFNQELIRYPNDPVSNYMAGQILRQQNKSAQAIPFLEAAIAVNPNYTDALMELAQCHILLNQPGEALKPLRKVIEINPSFAQAHFVLGTALSKLGDTAGAVQERKICGQLEAREHAKLIHNPASTQ